MRDLTTSNVLGSDCKAIAAELCAQPELLAGVFLENSEKLMPDEQAKVDQVKRFTGVRSASDEQRLLLVGALRLLGASDREIARTCGVSRNSVPVLLRELERTGRVEPLKDRLVKVVGDNAERSSLLLRDLMEKGLDGEVSMELAAMLKAVGSVNCFQVEKFQLLTGQATERVETVVAAGRDEIERFLRESAVDIEAVTVKGDSKSVGFSVNAYEIQNKYAAVTELSRDKQPADDGSGAQVQDVAGVAGERSAAGDTGGGDVPPPSQRHD